MTSAGEEEKDVDSGPLQAGKIIGLPRSQSRENHNDAIQSLHRVDRHDFHGLRALAAVSSVDCAIAIGVDPRLGIFVFIISQERKHT